MLEAQPWPRWLQIACIVLVAIVLAVPARIALVSTRLDDDARAPAAVVLGASVRAGEPSPVLRARLDYAFDLLRAGKVRQLILTGGVGAGQQRSEADVSRSYLLQRGAAPAALLLEARSHDTLQNLCFAQEIARAHGLSPLIVVSDALHLARALLLARDIGLVAMPAATPYSRYRRGFAALGFLLQESFLYSARLVTRPARCATALP